VQGTLNPSRVMRLDGISTSFSMKSPEDNGIKLAISTSIIFSPNE